MIISVGIPKGGAGKTTMLLSLASIGLDVGFNVVIIDSDTRQHSVRWAWMLEQRGLKPENLNVVSALTAQDVVEKSRAYDDDTTLVLNDTEGTASELLLAGMAAADLIIIPVQISPFDILSAVQLTDQYLPEVDKGRGYKAPRMFVVTNHSVIQSRANALAEVREILLENGTPIARTYLAHRSAYKALANGETLFNGIKPDPKAIQESRNLYDEILTFYAKSLEE
jgi:cellulose biosynthesis protein BcsQ